MTSADIYSTWDELYDVFGDNGEYDWALEQDQEAGQYEDEERPKVSLEDVFDPSEIKARRLQEEDRNVQASDRPERHQLLNSTLSENPIISSPAPFPEPGLAATYVFNKISLRTQYLFCGMHDEGSYPPIPADPTVPYYPAPRRTDLYTAYVHAVTDALRSVFMKQLEVPYLWHYQRDNFSVLENEGRSSVQLLERDELWTLYTLGIKFQAIYERVQQAQELWAKIKARRPAPDPTPAAPVTALAEGTEGAEGAAAPTEAKPEIDTDAKRAAADAYLEQTLLGSICLMSIEAAADAMDWLEYHYAEEVRHIREDEAAASENTRLLPERQGNKNQRVGPIMELVKAFGVDVPTVAVDFNDTSGAPPHAPKDVERKPEDLAGEYAGEETPFVSAESALRGECSGPNFQCAADLSGGAGACLNMDMAVLIQVVAAMTILTTEFAKDPAIRQQAREFVKECADITITPTDRGMSVIDEYHSYYVSHLHLLCTVCGIQTPTVSYVPAHRISRS